LEDVLQLTGYEVREGSDYAMKARGPPTNRLSKAELRKLYPTKYDSKVIQSLSVVDESVVNYELLAQLLEQITKTSDEGAILVFMPGMMEITKATEEIKRKAFLNDPSVALVLPLHSSLSTAEQKAVFDVPPRGVRKIIVATNIAETSITIEDVVYVVDAGRVKENRRDEVKETPALIECWVSRASAKQRRGRAGRVRPGIAYHMYSRYVCFFFVSYTWCVRCSSPHSRLLCFHVAIRMIVSYRTTNCQRCCELDSKILLCRS
jgi:superfamily II DNA/RNA helicase